jgi:hypothetical protein
MGIFVTSFAKNQKSDRPFQEQAQFQSSLKNLDLHTQRQ